MDHVLCGHLLILIIFTYFVELVFFRSVIIKRNLVIYFVGGWVGVVSKQRQTFT